MVYGHRIREYQAKQGAFYNATRDGLIVHVVHVHFLLLVGVGVGVVAVVVVALAAAAAVGGVAAIVVS